MYAFVWKQALTMTRRKALIVLQFLLPIFVSGAISICSVAAAPNPQKDSKIWKDTFDLSACAWSSTGKNDFFILEPGYREVLEGKEGGKIVRLEITVLNETMKIGNVETRVVEEREFHNGEVEEVSRNFLAVCGPANDVYYFGETVDIYEDGKVDDHEGEWMAGTADAKAGLLMPARPQIGDRFYQEIAPDVAMDRVEVISNSESLKTPAGEFHNCLKIEETNPLEPGSGEYKIYARGIGIIQDGDLLLVKYGYAIPKNETTFACTCLHFHNRQFVRL